ncbi:MAG: hypothetical protein K5840_00885 [Eubacterium sp.]|nr:hypothetical protein [Eubacterium sp.]
MIVNFEFLDSEPLENVITCMHFNVDRVVFFGYPKIIAERKDATKRFLRNCLGMENVAFVELSPDNLPDTLKHMRAEVDKEKSAGNEVFFDITGGEDLILVAFGMLAKEFSAPLHKFDIVEDRLIELDDGVEASIGSRAERRDFKLTLDNYIRMKGGVINHREMEEVPVNDAGFRAECDGLWRVLSAHKDRWNAFSDYLRGAMSGDDSLQFSKRTQTVSGDLSRGNGGLKSLQEFMNIVGDLAG